MIRFLAQVSGLLIVLFICAISSVTLITKFSTFNEIDQTRYELQTIMNCQSPCIMGIQMGITLDEVLNILNHHEWVGEINTSPWEMQGSGTNIRWTWSGQQPPFIDEQREGSLQTELFARNNTEVVVSMSLQTSLRFEDLYNVLGATEFGSHFYQGESYIEHPFISYSILYNDSALNLQTSISTTIPCPATLILYWNARTRIGLSSYTGIDYFMPPNELSQLCNQ